jgi:hypothetical protein
MTKECRSIEEINLDARKAAQRGTLGTIKEEMANINPAGNCILHGDAFHGFRNPAVSCDNLNLNAPKDARKEGKPRPSLLPMDILIEFLLPAYEEGLIKYEKESWRRGFKVSELMDAVDRHKSAFFHGCEDYDKEAEKNGVIKHHLSGAIFSLISALHTLKYHPELDDRRYPNRGDIKNGEIK